MVGLLHSVLQYLSFHL